MFPTLAVLENESIPQQMSITFTREEGFTRYDYVIMTTQYWYWGWDREQTEKFMNGLIVVVEGNHERYKRHGYGLMISATLQWLLMIYFLCIIGERLPTRPISRRAVRTCTHNRWQEVCWVKRDPLSVSQSPAPSPRQKHFLRQEGDPWWRYESAQAVDWAILRDCCLEVWLWHSHIRTTSVKDALGKKGRRIRAIIMHFSREDTAYRLSLPATIVGLGWIVSRLCRFLEDAEKKWFPLKAFQKPTNCRS